MLQLPFNGGGRSASLPAPCQRQLLAYLGQPQREVEHEPAAFTVWNLGQLNAGVALEFDVDVAVAVRLDVVHGYEGFAVAVA